ncbi:hypothetical protein AVEN_246158-1 [Araneus ventricosus]|uniref:Uncharacterized protein n=1 Tax=Araneus ventricosus TaxID=182803 RepID=A0A4Y2N0I5_ARAVE|nr:hypothetical protein AVEN_246158-1 [Araneus ventricosus]
MNRVAQLMNNLFVPTSLRGIGRNYRYIARNYLLSRRSGYQEIGAEPETSCWIKLTIYLGSAVAIALSMVAFAYGYVIIPAISTSAAVVCAALFWFRNSAVWGRLLECSRSVFCFPCNYFTRSVPDAAIRYERRHRQLLFERSVEVQADGAEEQSEAQTDGAEEQSEAQADGAEASSESESSITIDAKPVKVQNVAEI